MSDENKEIRVVTGDDSDLDISPVYEHLDISRPKTNFKKEDIVIPQVKKTKKDEDKDRKKKSKKDNGLNVTIESDDNDLK